MKTKEIEIGNGETAYILKVHQARDNSETGYIQLYYRGTIHTHTIWSYENENDYICLPSGEFDEDGEEILEDLLLTDLL